MTPELRAIADRFMYETGTLKHIVALLPEGAAARPVTGYEWTVAQLLAHLAQSLHTYQEPLHRWLRDENPVAGWDSDATNAVTAREHASSDPPALVALFGTGIRGLVTALAAVPDEKMEQSFGPMEPLPALRGLVEHAQTHAIALLDAVPEARMDPLVLNWLLYARFESDADREWQRALLAEAREYAANHPEEEDEE